MLQERHIAAGETYCCRRDILLQERHIAAGETYCCRRDILLQERHIAAGETYCCRRDILLQERHLLQEIDIWALWWQRITTKLCWQKDRKEGVGATYSPIKRTDL